MNETEPSPSETREEEYLDFPLVERGSPMKPDKQYFVAALAQGTSVGIHDLKVYPTFFKLFNRYCQVNKKKLKLHIRQQKPDLWLLIARKLKEEKPGYDVEGEWRQHGRYKYYARQLESGTQLSFSDREEALKARRSWQWYVDKKDRKGRQCAITPLPSSHRFVVSVQDKAG